MSPQATTTRKSRFRRRRYGRYRKSTTTARMMRAVAKDVVIKALSRRLEIKEKYSEDFADDINSVGSVNILSDIVSGIQSDQMIGSKAILMNAYLKYNIVAGDNTNICRLMVIQSLQQEANMNLASVFNMSQYTN